MKSIAFYNNKGGVAKTTTVLNIAYIIGEVYKRKVLVVDCDGQQNATRFLADEYTERGIESALVDSKVAPSEALSRTRYENIDVLTSTPDMNICAEKFTGLTDKEKEKNISKLKSFWNEKYDYVLLDLPPALNGLTEQLISSTDGVIVPIELGSFAIQGIAKVTDTINKVGASFLGCFISKYDKKNKADEVKPMVAIKALLSNKYWVIMFFAMLVIFFVIIFYAIGGVYYSLYIFKDMGQYSWMANSISISQFAIMFITPFLMTKFGKRWMYAAGMALLTLGFAGFGLFGTSKTIMIVCNVLKGCGLGISGAMAMGLVADAITYGTLKTGVNAVGMGNAGTSAAQKLGLGLGTAVFGWVMSGAGFKGEYDLQGIAQPESVETAIRFMYNWVPMVMCAIICVIFVVSFNLDRDLAKLRAEKGIDG